MEDVINKGIMLAHKYEEKDEKRCRGWLISEKLDGCYAYWTGTQMFSRQGKEFFVPKSFTKNFPNITMCGELWAGRDCFELTGVLRKKEPTDEDYAGIKFIVFDMPNSKKKFSERLGELHNLFDDSEKELPIKVIETWPFISHEKLQEDLEKYEKLGAEGLMLHNPDGIYERKRSRNLLKVKSADDAEAIVIGHEEGTGKYVGMTGSLRVRTPEGLEFNVGSGLNDEQRKTPPPIGSTITYKYNGFTKKTIKQKGQETVIKTPRFAIFLRVRETQ